ncbi:TIGR03089 family protein [Catenuloplanes japonicus]|uniref:TIGR03089 family protein n=1 Tax=Catenuloplanes japonicus TaxID=33876 RepID=UPI00052662AE|nr:TIGR03089 family protein [Catenuloplanes japonicus]
MSDVPAILAAAVAADPARPLLTYYDDATGERTELSGITLGNWVSKTANLLVDGLGLGPGDRADLLLPPHWQTAAILLASWSAGLTVGYRPWSTAGLTPEEGTPDVVFVSQERERSFLEDVPDADERFVLSMHPFAMPMREVPDGYRDFNADVRLYGDFFRASAVPSPSTPATADGTTFGAWGEIIAHIAGEMDLKPGDRVLIDAAKHEQPVQWLLAPLAAGATIVLVANPDASKTAARAESERVTRIL